MSFLTHKDTAYIMGIKPRQLEHLRYNEDRSASPAHFHVDRRIAYDLQEVVRWSENEVKKAQQAHEARLKRLEELTAAAESEAA